MIDKSKLIKCYTIANHQFIGQFPRTRAGNGRDLRSLHLKGQISLKVLAVLCRQFVRLEKVTLGDYFEAQIVRNSVEIGRLLGRLHRLHSFSLSVPELLPFDRHLNQLLDQWTRVASLRSSLTELELKGASFHSQTLARFCSTLTQLTLLSIVYENQFESIVRPQPHSFAEVANLSRLRLLTLIGVNLQADTLQTILISCNELTFVDVRLNPWLDQLALLSIVQYARRHSPRPVTVIAIGCSFVRNLQHLQCRTRNWQTFVQLLPTLELFIDKNDADLDALYDESIDDEEFD